MVLIVVLPPHFLLGCVCVAGMLIIALYIVARLLERSPHPLDLGRILSARPLKLLFVIPRRAKPRRLDLLAHRLRRLHRGARLRARADQIILRGGELVT